MTDPAPGPSPAPGAGKVPSLARNVVLNWIGFGTAVVYTLVITPIVIRGLEQENYGIWSILNALVGYSSLFYFGLGTSLTRYGAQHYATGNHQALNRLASVVFTIYLTIGGAALLAGIAGAPSLTGALVPDGSRSKSIAVLATIIVLAARLCLMFIGSVFAGLLVARGRMDLNSLIGIVGHLSRLALVPVAVKASNPLLALAVAVGATGAIEVAVTVVVTRRIDRWLRVWLVAPTAPELRMLYGFGLLAFFIQLADRLISYTDTLVIGVILGAGTVALYSVPLQLAEYGRMIVRGLSAVLLPHLAALHATGQILKLQRSYYRTVRLTALITIFVTISQLALGPTFLKLWVGQEYAQNALPLLFWLGIAGLAQAIGSQTQLQFCLAYGRIRFATVVLVAEGVINLVLSILLARLLGMTGVAVATAIPAIVLSGIALPVYVARMIDVPLRRLVNAVALPAIALTATLCAAYAVLAVLLPTESYTSLAIRFLIANAFGAGITWFVTPQTERRMLWVPLLRLKRKYFGVVPGPA